MILEAGRSALLIVDVQERLAPVTREPEAAIARCGILMRAAERLGVPILVSEQYPKGLGPTVEPLRNLVPAGHPVPKLHFSCTANETLRHQLKATERDQLVVAGMEAHVCVLQTALGAKADDYEVAVVADAVTSRDPANKAAALARLAANGVEIVTSEMVVFEWMGRAGTPEFKDLSALIR
jgi:nicotinamidase-related amidase